MGLRTLPYIPDPIPVLSALRPFGGAVLLQSSDRKHPHGRFDVLTAAPERWITVRGDATTLHEGGEQTTVSTDPLILLDHWLNTGPAAPELEDLPFSGGIIGLAGYDFGRRLQSLPVRPDPTSTFPDLIAGRYTWAIITDHRQQQTWLVVESGATAPAIDHLWTSAPPESPALTAPPPRLFADTDAKTYEHAFDRVAAYIRSGDCYQVNLAIRFSGSFTGDTLALYRHLGGRHPAPFAGYLDSPYGSVLSFSPERFLRTADGVIETAPIKGTRPRSLNAAEDRRLASELLASSKDRAENLMIVDLLRNDLGRSCRAGSIEVPNLFELESFGSVHHLVSRIRGQLEPGVSPLSAFAKAFPGGSITGAPKIRAMQIIDELEAHRRGPYCGSLFMVDGRGRMDSSITIRTLLAADGRLYCWGGGGLVADSVCAEEWAEIHHKVGALIG